MAYYDGKGNVLTFGTSSDIVNAQPKDDYKIIAHRGYYATVPQNTVESFIAAYGNGFRWVEIDIQQCTDGILVLNHDASITMYDDGTAVSVTPASCAYSDIKDYTLDSNGLFKMPTLRAAFNCLKLYDLYFVCDNKSGKAINEEIVRIASECGVIDKILISYYSTSLCLTDLELLAKYPTIPVRVCPDNYDKLLEIQSAIKNPLYADVIASNIGYMQTALSCGVPIVFAGTGSSNESVWQVVGAGCMGNGNLTHSYFKAALEQDYNKFCTITADESATVSVGSSVELAATSDLDDVAGYVYGYSSDPTIAKVNQSAFGQSAMFTVTGVSAGEATLKLFTGCGAIKEIAITVS